MSHVFPRHTRIAPPRATRGEGVWLIDAQGRRYLDGSGGAAVSCLGHGDAGVMAAIKDQLDRLAFAHTGFFTSDPAEELADLLIAHAPPGIARVYFVSGGSEAVEAALKLARQYMVETGQPGRHRVIARAQSYHGNTLGALAAGGNPARRATYAPLLVETSHIPPCYPYREQAGHETPEAYGRRAADALEAEIERLGPGTVIAFIAETVAGATLGAVPPARGYFARIRDICDRHGVLLILDEVMCGMGRTGDLFACTAEGVAPDIVTIAKGLGGGYQPIGAMLCSAQIYDAVAGGSGFFQHGHTYVGHPVACAAGLAVTRAILDRGLIGAVRAQGAVLAATLHDRFAQHAHVGEIRGRGLFLALELVADRGTKSPFDAALGLAARIKRAGLEAGLVCYPMGGIIDGVRGEHVLLAPPYIITGDELTMLVDRLAITLDTALSGQAPPIRC